VRVEVVIAYPDGAQARSVDLPAKATVRDALAACAIEGHAYGVFGNRVALDHRLQHGDRVEVYRPLAMDPKEARRQRARKNKRR
jgi:uncharacterized protein